MGLEQQDARVAIPGRTIGSQAATRQLQQETEVGHDLGLEQQDAVRRQAMEVGRLASVRDGGRT